MCPFCRRFERGNGAALRQLVDSGRAQWVVRPLAFLDRLSNGTRYSTRAGAAAFAIAQGAPDAFGAFHESLFSHQPREGSDGLDEATLVSLAEGAGATAEQAGHISDQTFAEAVAVETAAANDLGVQGTPTVLVSRQGVGRVMWDGETPLAELVRELQGA
jgi:protein-disulfide isomerase